MYTYLLNSPAGYKYTRPEASCSSAVFSNCIKITDNFCQWLVFFPRYTKYRREILSLVLRYIIYMCK